MLRWLRKRSGAHEAPRWVVVDVETTGMAASDDLLSIGAVAMLDSRVMPSDSFEMIVRRTRASARENILVHGIGAHAQQSGTDPKDVMRAFMDFIGRSPLIAFHAPFDRGFLARSIKVYVGQPFDNSWLDLAELAPVLDPAARLSSLDEWLEHYQIPITARHSAAADAFGTALLAMRLLPEAKRQGAHDFSSLQRMARDARWMP
jgi:DNA polymerase-3 subunit epsilon